MTTTHAPVRHKGLAAVVAGFEGALESVPFIVVAALVAFEPMGEAMSGIGITAAFVGSLLVSFLMAIVADRRGLTAGPSLGLALLIAGALRASIQQGILNAEDTGLALSISMLLTLGHGVLMAGIAALGVGRLAPLVPYPVLAGLRNGIAVLLVLEQVHAAVGISEHEHGGPHLGAMVVTAVTVLAMFVRIRSIPAIVVSLLAGTAVHYCLGMLPHAAETLGPVTASNPPDFRSLTVLGGELTLLKRLPGSLVTQVLLPTILSMTVLAVLETVACASALHSATGERGGGRRDLLAIALANMLGGTVGALPSSGSLEETIPSIEHPLKRSRVAELSRVAVLLALGVWAMPWLTRVPNAVLAGLIIVAAVEVSDLSSLRTLLATARAGHRQRVESIGAFLIAVGVALVAATLGLATAVIAGVVLSLVVFVADMSHGPVRRRYTNPVGRSRARRGEQETEALLTHGQAIEVIELQGALFFGSTDQVAAELERRRHGGRGYLVLDMHRIHRMDLSGARGLLGACDRIWARGSWLVLAGMRPGLPAWDYLCDRQLDHRLPTDRVFPTLEDALASTEARLLADFLGEVNDPVFSGRDALLALGVPADVVPVLLARMMETAFPSAATIIRTGDRTRDCFILLEGRVDVMLHVDGDGTDLGRFARVATLAPGTMFGEMAMLSDAPRSADLVTAGPVRCLRLDLADLEAMRAEHPDSAWYLLSAIALQMDRNLRLTNAAIATYEE